jgi:dihydrofolate synthase/folylpolyglutamate synthase
MSAAYKHVIRQLYERNVRFPVSMGLKNATQLYHLLGNPLDNIPGKRYDQYSFAVVVLMTCVTVIHVGGTNGKGSVCYKLAESMRLCGLNVGLFVSPHISSFRERIQVNGKILTEEEVLVRDTLTSTLSMLVL